jgi:hypothetical protein
MSRLLTLGLIAASIPLSACGFIRDDINKTLGRAPTDNARQADLAASQVTTIGVNAYLWRAALETLSFAPTAQVDSAGGVIVTDWYTNPNSPSERMKVSATISIAICGLMRFASPPRARSCRTDSGSKLRLRRLRSEAGGDHPHRRRGTLRRSAISS